MSQRDEEISLKSHATDVGHERRSRPVEWVLVDGDRIVLTAAILAAVYPLFLGLGRLDVIGFTNANSITRIASGLIAGTFSLVTLVVSLNQLILSREFGGAGEIEDRLAGVMDFRRDIEEMAAVPASPATPARLFALVTEAIHRQAAQLDEAVGDELDEKAGDRVRSYVSGVLESTERIHETFGRTGLGTFAAVSASVDYNDSWQIYAARQLKNRYDDELPEEASTAFEDLIDALQLFNVARTHFKTTYLQRELTKFSRQTIYCGVPSVLSAILLGFLYAETGGAAIDPTLLPYVTPALVVVVLSPLALLAAYILRTATMAHRTASVGPVIPQKAPEEESFDVSYDGE